MPAEQRSALLSTDALDVDIRNEVVALLEVSMSRTVQRSLPKCPAAGPEYATGREFGRYIIIGTIGQGGFGRIYAARDKELRRVVAIKILSGTLREAGEPLIEEARAASALNHPNIITIHETIFADDHVAIVMEFVDGQSLRQIFREADGPLPVETVVRYGKQMAQALAAAHEAGIVHRDVKPENILLRKDEYIKLVDFGLATGVVTTPGPGVAGPLTGTLRYISPEQLRGEPSSTASDVFSLGLVLYEMAAGVHPFRGTTPLEAADAIATEQPVPLSRTVQQVPAKLDRLILAMLSKNPVARPSAGEVAQSLEQIASDAGRRLKRPMVMGLAALVISAGALALVLPQWTRKPSALVLRLDTRPLTGEAGRETRPALSPDGLSVMYSLQKSADSKELTFLREIGSDQKTILPISGAYGWLPDSRRIGFLRRNNGLDALCTTSRDGSGEQEILKAREILYFEWSPNGEWIVYVARPATGSHAIFLFETSTGKNTQITFPPATARGDKHFAISPDGRQLAFRRTFNHGHSDVFLISLPAPGPARQITFHDAAGDTVAWLRNSSAIISSASPRSNFSLWLHPLSSPERPTRLTELGMEAVGIRSALGRNRLVWANSLEDTNIWSVPVTGGKPVRVVASAMRDVDVALSSLGLLAFRSDRSGFPEIWISGKNGESQKKVTDLRGFTGSPRWSPDGRRLAFDSRRTNAATDVYVMDCDPVQLQCGPPLQVTDNDTTDGLPSWSADGSHLYFASLRSGEWQVWKTAASGKSREAIQMTTQGGYFAAESADGRWLYYSRIDSPEAMGVWRKPLGSSSYRADDTGEMILPMEYRATATWILSGREIFYYTLGDGYYTPGEGREPVALWAFDLQTRRKRMVHRAGDAPLGRGLALSPDGNSLFFVRLDRSESNIMVADYEVVK
jgi:serine/threonine protein kinase/Tol biopolymer transport system component